MVHWRERGQAYLKGQLLDSAPSPQVEVLIKYSGQDLQIIDA
jgi:hypothetical protein